MEHSQLHRNYWTFSSEEEVTEPFEYVRTLSNGVVIGKCNDDQQYGLTLDYISSYIKANHINPPLETLD